MMIKEQTVHGSACDRCNAQLLAIGISLIKLASQGIGQHKFHHTLDEFFWTCTTDVGKNISLHKVQN